MPRAITVLLFAGFCVGVVEKSNIIDGSCVQVGDTLIALGSSGPHSNGYSLIRKILTLSKSSLDEPFEDATLGDALLTPTRLYVKSLLSLIKTTEVHALAHITGGGLLENIPRVLPIHTEAILDTSSWTWPKIFQWIQSHGNVSDHEMLRTFNVGVGMVFCVNPKDAQTTIESLLGLGEQAWIIGHIDRSDHEQPQVILR